jgi:tetratricopeptide (TPR) repeat protein
MVIAGRLHPAYHLCVMVPAILFGAMTGVLWQSPSDGGAGPVPDGFRPADQVAMAALPARRQLPPEELADIFMARKKYREALEQYKRCDQTSAVILNKAGIAYHELLDLSSAMAEYRRATKLDPNYPEAFNNLGTVYYSQKSFRRAIHLYKTALRLAPESATVYSNLGSAYFSTHRFRDAMAAYVKALDLDPNVFLSNSSSGVLLQEQTVEDKATFHYYMARVYARKGMTDLALQNIRRSLEEGFKDPRKFRQEAEFAVLNGNPEFEALMKRERRAL